MPASKLDPRVSLRSLWSPPCAVCLCFLPCPVGPSPGCETWVRLPFSLSALSSSASAASSTHCCSVLSKHGSDRPTPRLLRWRGTQRTQCQSSSEGKGSDRPTPHLLRLRGTLVRWMGLVLSSLNAKPSHGTPHSECTEYDRGSERVQIQPAHCKRVIGL